MTQLVGKSSFFQTLALAFTNTLLFLAFLCFQLFRQFSHKDKWGANDPTILESDEYPRIRRILVRLSKFEEYPCIRRIRLAKSKKRTLDPTTSSTTPNRPPSDTGESTIPQALPESIPQASPEPVPQPLIEYIPRGLPEHVPQALPESIPQAFPKSIPQVLRQAWHQSNARPGEEDEKPKLGFSMAIGIFAFAFLVCGPPIS